MTNMNKDNNLIYNIAAKVFNQITDIQNKVILISLSLLI